MAVHAQLFLAPTDMVILKKWISRHRCGRVTNLRSRLPIVTNMVISTAMIRRKNLRPGQGQPLSYDLARKSHEPKRS